ncbi:MAG: hypothetical protein ACLSB9_19995 [Hydrogeniiclostridium mannosilyticum]
MAITGRLLSPAALRWRWRACSTTCSATAFHRQYHGGSWSTPVCRFNAGADSGEALYYDTDEGGIVVKQKLSILNLNVVIPSSALKQTLNVLLEKIDNEVLANPALLDAVVEKLVSGLTAIPVAEDKSLLDYVNYIYQSHLAGADSGDQPEWVAAATKKIENGELLEAILQAVIADVADVANQALANLPLEDVLGATAWNNTTKEFVAAGGRTPLVRPLDKSGENALSIALGVLVLRAVRQLKRRDHLQHAGGL